MLTGSVVIGEGARGTKRTTDMLERAMEAAQGATVGVLGERQVFLLLAELAVRKSDPRIVVHLHDQSVRFVGGGSVRVIARADDWRGRNGPLFADHYWVERMVQEQVGAREVRL